MSGRRFGWRWPVVLIVAVLASGCGWAMLDYGPQRAGYNPAEKSIDAANVHDLAEAWTTTAGNGAPVVAGGKLYVVDSGDSLDDRPGVVRAFDAAGKANCSTSTKVCAPVWKATFPGAAAIAPAVVDGVVYISTEFGLLTYDAAGDTGCSGTPKICTPLWTGTANSIHIASPLVWNGTVYVGSTFATLSAFDAAGETGCGGTPKTCAPIWTATTSGAIYAPPAGAAGILYVGTIADTHSLQAFDAAGVTNCSGTTKTCLPLWAGDRPEGSGPVRSAPAITDGIVYVGDASITAFDAAGVTNCSGGTCLPLWDTPAFNAEFNGPAVAKGVVYGTYHDGHLYTLDAAGIANCSGTPKACTPLWSAAVTFSSDSSASIANGVVYLTGGSTLYAFDAAGVDHCTGSPKVCTPLWTGAGYSLYSPTIVNGVVFASDGTKVHAYALP